jgi:hypothetical protein
VKGAVFDAYVRGMWSRAEAWTAAPSSRSHLEFEVHCLVSDTLAPPLGWARSAVGTDGRLLVPPQAGCVGVVADSLPHTSAGEWKHPDEGIARGWMWFPGEIPRTVRPSERHVPSELEGMLDSALSEALPSHVQTDSVPMLLARWFRDGFVYSLDVPDPGEDEPLRAFLADRRGFCEHFATAGTLLARRARAGAGGHGLCLAGACRGGLGLPTFARPRLGGGLPAENGLDHLGSHSRR